MSIRIASGLPERIIQVLKDFLPAELDLIDAEEWGEATPDVAVADYHPWDRPLITKFPAITVAVLRARPLETHPQPFGSEVHWSIDVDVSAHFSVTQDDTWQRMQVHCFRYGAGLFRVLCIQKVLLETSGDPNLWAHDVRCRDLRFGPETAQAGGTVTRTVTLGIEVTKIETR